MAAAPLMTAAPLRANAQAALAIETAPECLPHARALARLIENATASSVHAAVEILAAHEHRGVTVGGTSVGVETLHRLTDKHPGFAYFAGLPGHLGLTSADHFNWITSRDAQLYLTELQRLCAVRCIIVGRDAGLASGQSTRSQAGLIATVYRALGTTAHICSSGKRAQSAQTIVSPFGSTVAITASEETWRGAPPAIRSSLLAAAALYAQQEHAQHNDPCGPLPQSEFTQIIDRIAEATVAQFANHDVLTRRINASYFAFRRHQKALAPKNSV